MKNLKEEFNDYVELKYDMKDNSLKHLILNTNTDFFVDFELNFHINNNSNVIKFYENEFNRLKEEFLNYKIKKKIYELYINKYTEKNKNKRSKI